MTQILLDWTALHVRPGAVVAFVGGPGLPGCGRGGPGRRRRRRPEDGLHVVRRRSYRGARTASAPASGTGRPEETDHPREVIEAALAHVVRSRVEVAYARSDLFERRRLLMDDWAAYLDGETIKPVTGCYTRGPIRKARICNGGDVDFGELKEVTPREVWGTKRSTSRPSWRRTWCGCPTFRPRRCGNALQWRDNLAGRPAPFPRRRRDAQAVGPWLWL